MAERSKTAFDFAEVLEADAPEEILIDALAGDAGAGALSPDLADGEAALQEIDQPTRPRAEDPARTRTYAGVERLAEEIRLDFADVETTRRLFDQTLDALARDGELDELALSDEVVMARALPDFANDPAERRADWIALARAMVELAPDHQDPTRSLGGALATAGVCPRDVLRLATAGDRSVMRDTLVRLARWLKEAGIRGVDWRPVAHEMLNPSGPRAFERVLRDFYAQPRHSLIPANTPDIWDWDL